MAVHDLRRRYQNCPVFRRLVDTFERSLEEAEVTPSELRDAVILAAIHYDLRHPRPFIVDARSYALIMGQHAEDIPREEGG